MANWTRDEHLTFDIAFALKKVTIPGPANDRHLHQDHFDSDRGLLGGDCGEASLTGCQWPNSGSGLRYRATFG